MPLAKLGVLDLDLNMTLHKATFTIDCEERIGFIIRCPGIIYTITVSLTYLPHILPYFVKNDDYLEYMD